MFRFLNSDNFRMTGDIFRLFFLIMPARNDFVIFYDDAADGDFAFYKC